MGSHYLAIDIGTSSAKVLLLSPKGRIEEAAEADYPVSAPKPGWSEQDPKQWWDAVETCVKRIRKEAASSFKRVKAIGLSGQMHGSVFLDANREVIRKALLWNDQRTEKQTQAILRAAGGSRLLLQMVNNGAMTGYTAPKILWLRDNEPKNYERLRSVILPKDYIALRLTQNLSTDVSDASGTLLFDVSRRQWSDRLIGLLKIDKSFFPRAFESVESIGELSSDVAEQWGLSRSVLVCAGAGDQPAAAVGMGIVKSGQASSVLGTSGVVFAALDKFVPNHEPSLQIFCSAVPQGYGAFGCMLSAGDSLQWYLDCFEGGSGEAAYCELIRLAQSAHPGAQGLTFLPYLSGERCPHSDPAARGGWIGINRSHTKAEMVRAIFEGVTFGMKDQMLLMKKEGITISEVVAGGGGARSPFWLQLQADIFRVPVKPIQTPHASALGAGILAMVCAKEYGSVEEAAYAILQWKEKYVPSPKSAKLLQNAYEKYRTLYPTLRPWFRNESVTTPSGVREAWA